MKQWWKYNGRRRETLRVAELQSLLTLIERVAVAGDELERDVVCESILELVPHAVSVLAAVTQLDDQSHRSRATSARVIRTEPTTTTKRDTIPVAPPGGKGRGSFPPLRVDVQKLCNMCVLSWSWNFFVSHDKYIARPSSKEPR